MCLLNFLFSNNCLCACLSNDVELHQKEATECKVKSIWRIKAFRYLIVNKVHCLQKNSCVQRWKYSLQLESICFSLQSRIQWSCGFLSYNSLKFNVNSCVVVDPTGRRNINQERSWGRQPMSLSLRLMTPSCKTQRWAATSHVPNSCWILFIPCVILFLHITISFLCFF